MPRSHGYLTKFQALQEAMGENWQVDTLAITEYVWSGWDVQWNSSVTWGTSLDLSLAWSVKHGGKQAWLGAIGAWMLATCPWEGLSGINMEVPDGWWYQSTHHFTVDGE